MSYEAVEEMLKQVAFWLVVRLITNNKVAKSDQPLEQKKPSLLLRRLKG